MSTPTTLATDAASACIKIKGALADEAALRKVFAADRLNPSKLVEGCIEAGCPITGLELRGLLTMLWDGIGELEIGSDALVKAVLEAPSPPSVTPPTVQLDDAEVLVVDVADPAPQAEGAAAAEPPPSVPASMVPPPTSAPVWESFEPAASTLPKRQQHEHYTRQAQQAPYATMPVAIAPLFGPEHVRAPEDGNEAIYFDPRMSSAGRAAFLAHRARKGAAGKPSLGGVAPAAGASHLGSDASSRPSTATAARRGRSRRRPDGAAREAFDACATAAPDAALASTRRGPLEACRRPARRSLSAMAAAAAVGAGACAHATLPAEQMLERRMAERERLGPRCGGLRAAPTQMRNPPGSCAKWVRRRGRRARHELGERRRHAALLAARCWLGTAEECVAVHVRLGVRRCRRHRSYFRRGQRPLSAHMDSVNEARFQTNRANRARERSRSGECCDDVGARSRLVAVVWEGGAREQRCRGDQHSI